MADCRFLLILDCPMTLVQALYRAPAPPIFINISIARIGDNVPVELAQGAF